MFSYVTGKGEDLVFLHGWGGSTASFEGVAKRLNGRYRCILFDLYGFGKTPIEREMTLDDYADGVERALSDLGVKRAIVVGHSFGGRIALLLAARKSPLVRAIVLTDAAGMRPRRSLRKAWRRCKYRWRKRLGLSLDRCGSPDYRALDGALRRTFVNVVNRYQDDSLSFVDVPTLIVWGKRDRDTPMYMARRLRRGIRDSGLVVLDGGHYSYLDSLGQYVAVLGSFAESVYGMDMDCGASRCGDARRMDRDAQGVEPDSAARI